MARITLDDGGKPYPDGLAWREMTDYEHAIVERLLKAPFPGREAVRDAMETARVRRMDECGCIEFEQTGERRPYTVPAEGTLPQGHPSYPIELMLSIFEDCTPNRLEFIRYAGPRDVWPDPADFDLWLRDENGAITRVATD